MNLKDFLENEGRSPVNSMSGGLVSKNEMMHMV